MGERDIPCNRLIITTGPNCAKTFTTLYPEADLKGPIYADNASYSLLLSPSPEKHLDSDSRNKSVIYRSRASSLHIVSRADGTIHAATKPPADLESLDDLESGIQSLLSVDSKVCQRQTCSNPKTSSGIPVMSRVPSTALRKDALEDCGSGVYIIGGHGFWGVTASLGSGKLMAQLLLGWMPDLSLDIFRLCSLDEITPAEVFFRSSPSD